MRPVPGTSMPRLLPVDRAGNSEPEHPNTLTTTRDPRFILDRAAVNAPSKVPVFLSGLFTCRFWVVKKPS